MITKHCINTHSTANRGDLSVISLPDERELAWQVPFKVKRMFWITRMPQLAKRGGHAHREGQQFMFCPIGGVQIHSFAKGGDEMVMLSGPENAIAVPPMHWLEIRNTSPKTVLVVLASNEYAETDYIRDRGEFMSWLKS